MKIIESKTADKSSHICTIETGQGEIPILWISDAHEDNPKTKNDFLERILGRYPDALLIIGGDHLDVMQNTGDRRANKSSLKEEFSKDTYLNEIIDHNVEKWGKYAKRIIAFFIGNHEATQIKFHGIDITREIIKNLNLKYGTNIIQGDLAGWLKLRFDNKGRYFTKNIYYQHKPISGGSRSKGMLSVDIIKGRYPDADIFISEHIHDTWAKPERVERLLPKGKIKYENKWVLQMPTLKDEFAGVKRGYTHDRKYGATPIGLMVLQFRIGRSGVSFSPKYELID